ncbi:hypothetical protein PACTADRAFT_76304 [Pachysolen tannophilus NRRL Y-2460]|uniref:non-specific serine/threonine protein kinase n=1 Tax=Pachysolen tannophilus NRRL Y-2460 TaxID=669874 RepID=A0A1E4TSH0_PACTA|nr:hypothetical protein PACTADRAFT_76304 [Pachysolen tannophilus NRRL Y-2460]
MGISNTDLSEILRFPRESPQAYSYAQLSPNSLALRLNVLKRSLEIMIERPELFSSLSSIHQESASKSVNNCNNNNNNNNSLNGITGAEMIKSPTRNSISNIYEEDGNTVKVESGASAAALSALFKQHLPNYSSRPGTPTPSRKVSLDNGFGKSVESLNETTYDLKDVIRLLENKQIIDVRRSNSSGMVNELHDLSLSNLRTDNSRQIDLQIRLLHALATPFLENVVSSTQSQSSNARRQLYSSSTSTLALSSLQQQQQQLQENASMQSPTNLYFHSMSTNKKTTPQAIFTCEVKDPWTMKAANDMACLMFGVSKSSLKSFRLMDLIAPRSRDFVRSKLLNHRGNQVFTGEIVAIARPDNAMAWTSLWAKIKNDLIILIFDQVPCDSIDIVMERKKGSISYVIKSYIEKSGDSLFHAEEVCGKNVGEIINCIDKDIEELESGVGCPFANSNVVSSKIKETRYYTLSVNDIAIPSVITSITLDDGYDTESSLVKLNIHALHYMAGTFVISSRDFSILSYNSAIAKNLFGHGELSNKSIDHLLPNFSALLNEALAREPSLKDQCGLVLPEHFFRKLSAQISSGFDETKAEYLFLNSNGIDGLHRDGKIFKVDVQLRVCNSQSFVVWITYSRSVSAKSSKNDNQRSEKPRIHFDNVVGGRSNFSDIGEDCARQNINGRQTDREIDLPSQMDLFPENDNEIASCGSSNDALSRSNSTKLEDIHKPNTSFDLKIEKLKHRHLSSSDSSTTTSLNKHSNKQQQQQQQQRDMKLVELNGKICPIYNESELLEMENEELKSIKSKSSLWPKEVGLKRREKKLSDFVILKNMGEGAYGKVVQAQHKDDPFYKLIIKCIVKERILVDTWVRDRKLGTVPSEIQIMVTLNHNPHPNIMRIVDFFEDQQYYYLEIPQHGDPPAIDLFDLIEIHSSMIELECRYIFRQIVSAMNHLHKNGVVHRDVKDENIIVDTKGIVKLIDFGSAAYVKNGPFDVFVGTIDYAAPEVLNGKPYEGKPQDVWATGVLLYTLLYKENPFYNVDEIMEGELRIPYVVSEGATSLIKKILNRDIEKRPTMQEILEHEWLISI